MKYASQKQLGRIFLALSIALLIGLVVTASFTTTNVAFAQDDVAVTDTATAEPPTVTPTPTFTPVPPTSTSLVPTNTPTSPPPVQIPEPITVVLFGTGLAALSAAAAVRRKKQE